MPTSVIASLPETDSVNSIIDLEWAMFTTVNNEGGRASCQDDRVTFDIMRRAQLQAWDEPTRQSYITDLETAKAAGENLLTYKYGYMMAHSDPAGYARIKDFLPAVSDGKRTLVDRIIRIQQEQNKILDAVYPGLMTTVRPMDREGDGLFATSIPTYLEGELLTYSEETLKRYLDHLTSKEGADLVRKILTYTVQSYGFTDLDDAAAAIAR